MVGATFESQVALCMVERRHAGSEQVRLERIAMRMFLAKYGPVVGLVVVPPWLHCLVYYSRLTALLTMAGLITWGIIGACVIILRDQVRKP